MTRDVLDPLRDGTAAAPLPPPGAQIERALASIAPVKMRRPRRDMALIAGLGLVHAAVLLVVLGLRHDLAELPRPWLVAYLVAWLIGSGVALRVGLVPSRGEVMPRPAVALWVAVAAGIGFVLAGLVLARGVEVPPPQATMMREIAEGVLVAPAAAAWLAGVICLAIGLAAAAVPVALAVIALRGAAQVRERAIAAALGAAGGCLGGFMLHLHCPITDRFHLGLAHGGVVVAAAAITAVIASRALAGR